jgi:hypothetical protein
MNRSPFRLLVLAVTAAVAALVLAVPAQAAAPYCGITWGSLAKQGPAGTGAAAGQTLTGVRAGRHECYDRLVLDIHGTAPRSWRVEYVRALTEDPSGRPVPLDGAADLQIVVGASDHDTSGRPTYRPADPRHLVGVTRFSAFRQVAAAGSFEGLTTVGLGVRARLPFRVFTLDSGGGGSRVVVDVAHRW